MALNHGQHCRGQLRKCKPCCRNTERGRRRSTVTPCLRLARWPAPSTSVPGLSPTGLRVPEEEGSPRPHPRPRRGRRPLVVRWDPLGAGYAMTLRPRSPEEQRRSGRAIGEAADAGLALRMLKMCPEDAVHGGGNCGAAAARESLVALQANRMGGGEGAHELAAYAALVTTEPRTLACEPDCGDWLGTVAELCVTGGDREAAWDVLRSSLELEPRLTPRAVQVAASRLLAALARELDAAATEDVQAALCVAGSWARSIQELGGTLIGRGSPGIQKLLDMQLRLLQHAAPAVRIAAHGNWAVLADSWWAAGELSSERRRKRLALLVLPFVRAGQHKKRPVTKNRVSLEPDATVRRAMVQCWLHVCARVSQSVVDATDAAAVLMGSEESLHWNCVLPLLRTGDDGVQVLLLDFAAALLGAPRAAAAGADGGTGSQPVALAAEVIRYSAFVPGLIYELSAACDRWECIAGSSAEPEPRGGEGASSSSVSSTTRQGEVLVSSVQRIASALAGSVERSMGAGQGHGGLNALLNIAEATAATCPWQR